MEIVKPWIKVEDYDPVKIMKNLEKACRTCYRSEGSIKEGSYKKLLANAVKRGHESILEHEKVTVRIYSDIGFYKDITRHRAGTAFSIESTRYCNYSKDKFSNNIKFVEPIWMPKEHQKIWKKAMAHIEKCYFEMAQDENTIVDELRMLLPHSTAAEVTMTCNIREWKHILTLRCSDKVHPSIRQILIPLLLQFKKDMPEIFDSVPYDENYPSEWYAEISTMKDED